MNANDIDVRIENGVLRIRGERKMDPQIQQESAHRLERRYGGFLRSFELPKTFDPGKTAARYSDGVLEVSVPKAESAKPRRVRIEVA
jgi:HSP20 family protein